MKREYSRTLLLLFSSWLLLVMLAGCNCGSSVVAEGVFFEQPEPRQETAVLGPCLRVAPVHFGEYAVSCSEPVRRPVQIFHTGQAHCPEKITIRGVAFSDAGSGRFSLFGSRSLPLSISSGQSAQMMLEFQTTALGLSKARLDLKTDLPQQEDVSVPLSGTGTNNVFRVDTFQQEAQPSDILFVIDNSCSMKKEQSSLGSNFQSFIQWAQQLRADFQIGVISTDTFEDDSGCLVGEKGSRILTSKTKELAKKFAANTQLGIEGSPKEKGLQAAYLALHPPKVNDPNCNKGFLRTNALLSLIFVSDEPDNSDESVEYYLNAFKKLKGEGFEYMVRASAVVGPEKDFCQSSHGIAEAGPRYRQVAKELGGVIASICSANWSESLKRIGLASVVKRLRFTLNLPAYDNSIDVRVNGKTIPSDEADGWTYDQKTNQVAFHGSHIPTPGARIEIRYLAKCGPSTP